MIRTAIDSSVLLDVFSADPVYGERSLECLQRVWQEGSLIACDVVWAEIFPRFPSENEFLKTVEKMTLMYDPLNQSSAIMAGLKWREYRKGGGKKELVIADFLIGAHALNQADRFLTRNRGFYRKYFSQLKIIEP